MSKVIEGFTVLEKNELPDHKHIWQDVVKQTFIIKVVGQKCSFCGKLKTGAIE